MPPRIPILMYHRIATPRHDPFRIAVPAARFRRHMELLADRFSPVSLSDVVAGRAQARTEAPPVAVTLDDGYADVLQEGLPALDASDVHATVFVASGFVGSSSFWWDELEALFLGRHELPTELSLRIGEQDFTATLATSGRSWLEAEDEFRGWSIRDGEPPPTARHEVFLRLSEALRGLVGDSREAVLDDLRDWAGHPAAETGTCRPLSVEELGRLTASRCIEIGGHTVSHPALSLLTSDERRTEISGGRRQLEALVGPVRHFAYPFGDWRGSRRHVRKAGFASACVTRSRARRLPDRYCMPRLYVGDWDDDVFLRRLSEWIETG